MNESIIISESVKAYFSAHTGLGAIGTKIRKLKLFEPIVQEVKIAQKIVRYSPSEKLLDALLAILAGAQGNKCVRTYLGLQRAFGRMGCAEWRQMWI